MTAPGVLVNKEADAGNPTPNTKARISFVFIFAV
jgi:hypothetical protein